MLLVVVLAVPSAAAPIIERVLAVVSGSIITLSDVHAAIRFGVVDVAGAADPVGAALDRLIERVLMLAEVERYAPPEPSADEIDARVRALRAPFPSDAELGRVLQIYGVTPERLRAFARDDLRLAAYLDQRFASAGRASDEDVLRFYRDHQEEFTRGGVLLPLAEVEGQIRRRLDATRRAQQIEEWTRGLRLRADVTVLYEPGLP
jgi:hypothetical protein